jgi:hypothetical protein
LHIKPQAGQLGEVRRSGLTLDAVVRTPQSRSSKPYSTFSPTVMWGKTALIGRRVGCVAARQLYPSFIGPLEARDHAKGRSSCPSRTAQQCEELVLSYFEVDPIDRLLYTLERPWCE